MKFLVLTLDATFCHHRKMMIKINDVERFFKKIEKTDTCWIWRGTLLSSGHGIFHPSRKGGIKRIIQLAHRISWNLFRGKIRDGLFVLHRCNNPSCVNPDHLYLGTQKENIGDEIKAGTFIRGTRHPLAKLKESDIPKILKLANEGMYQRKIASIFGVDQSLIWRIIHRKSWPHIKH